MKLKLKKKVSNHKPRPVFALALCYVRRGHNCRWLKNWRGKDAERAYAEGLPAKAALAHSKKTGHAAGFDVQFSGDPKFNR